MVHDPFGEILVLTLTLILVDGNLMYETMRLANFGQSSLYLIIITSLTTSLFWDAYFLGSYTMHIQTSQFSRIHHSMIKVRPK